MSDEAPLLELFERLAPNKNKKWAGWVQKLQGQDIDNEEDVLNLSEKAIDGLPITEPLKDILRKVRQVAGNTNHDNDVSLPQTSVRPGVHNILLREAVAERGVNQAFSKAKPGLWATAAAGVSATAAAATGVSLAFRILLPGSGRLSTGKVTPFAIGTP